MPVIKTYDLQDFKNEFDLYNRKDHFTPEALEIIFDYLNQQDYTFQMDVVCFCCEFVEMSCAAVHESYDVGFFDDEIDDSVWIDAARDYLNDNTSIVGEYIEDDGTVNFVFVSF